MKHTHESEKCYINTYTHLAREKKKIREFRLDMSWATMALSFRPCIFSNEIELSYNRISDNIDLVQKKGDFQCTPCEAYAPFVICVSIRLTMCYLHTKTENNQNNSIWQKRERTWERKNFDSYNTRYANKQAHGMLNKLFRPPDTYIRPWTHRQTQQITRIF